MKKELAIIVYSCWKNADMWPIFGRLFQKYWQNCKYELILVTDRKLNDSYDILFDKIISIDGSWYEMIQMAIREADSEYVMLMMDDYLLCDYVDEGIIDRSIKDAERYKVANIRFEKSDLLLDKKEYPVDSKYEVYTPGKAYSLTTQVGIWNAECLMEYMKPEWSAWDFERIGSLTVRDTKHVLLGTKEYAFPYVEGVRKGKWMKQGIEVCKRNDIVLDFNKRNKLSITGNNLISLKTRIYNINPTLMLRLYNTICKLKLQRKNQTNRLNNP